MPDRTIDPRAVVPALGRPAKKPDGPELTAIPPHKPGQACPANAIVAAMLSGVAAEQTGAILVELFNQMRAMQVQLAALTTILRQRGLVTEIELRRTQIEIGQRADAELQEQMAILGGQMTRPRHPEGQGDE